MDWAGATRAALDSTRRAIATLAFLFVAPCAFAHAIVTSSQPAPNAVVAPGDLHVRLAFSSRIDPARSRVALTGPDGRQSILPIADAGTPGVVTAQARVVATGRWTLHWEVLSLDGHVTRGDVPFRVDAASGAR